jgi:hypothetical protein
MSCRSRCADPNIRDVDLRRPLVHSEGEPGSEASSNLHCLAHPDESASLSALQNPTQSFALGCGGRMPWGTPRPEVVSQPEQEPPGEGTKLRCWRQPHIDQDDAPIFEGVEAASMHAGAAARVDGTDVVLVATHGIVAGALAVPCQASAERGLGPCPPLASHPHRASDLGSPCVCPANLCRSIRHLGRVLSVMDSAIRTNL